MNAPGDVVDGRFELVEPLGSGGMGTVWRAWDSALHREVALKAVRPEAAASDAVRERVLREARALARLSHPHVVTVHHIVVADPHPWIVMELVPGDSLQQRLHETTLTPVEAARIGRQVLWALNAAHAAGIQHRDVKPANVLLRPDGIAVLTDFGIAALQGSSSLTQTGELVGTVEYMAPERIRGQNDDPASDLWSLGLVLYACVEGVSPLRRDNAFATLAAVLDDPIPTPVRSGPLAPALGALLVRDPAQRPDAAALDALLAQAGQAGQAGHVGQAAQVGQVASVVANHPARPATQEWTPQRWTPQGWAQPEAPAPPAPTPPVHRAHPDASARTHVGRRTPAQAPAPAPAPAHGRPPTSGRVAAATAPPPRRARSRMPLIVAAFSTAVAVALGTALVLTLRDNDKGADGASGAPDVGASDSTDVAPSPQAPDGTPDDAPAQEPSAPPGGKWIAQVLSEPTSTGPGARDEKLARIRQTVPDVKYVRSDNYASLRPGYWIFYAPGPFKDGKAALTYCQDHGMPAANDCFGRFLSNRPADSTLQCRPPLNAPKGRCTRS
ncbi:serine/threonine-protein kinase [Streptomyces sp. NPDC017979]|uniref:serine/threonine-protein kinase n=1 Tax=Streptomyces sp. NPDC017979 TaxID=3365024 RepID=UPI0037994506